MRMHAETLMRPRMRMHAETLIGPRTRRRRRRESFWEEIGFTDLLAILGVSKRN